MFECFIEVSVKEAMLSAKRCTSSQIVEVVTWRFAPKELHQSFERSSNIVQPLRGGRGTPHHRFATNDPKLVAFASIIKSALKYLAVRMLTLT
jgi:hypothetical protein